MNENSTVGRVGFGNGWEIEGIARHLMLGLSRQGIEFCEDI